MAEKLLETLYRRALTGDRAAEDGLLEALSARFRLVAAKRVWDEQDARDIVQEALVTVHRRYVEGGLETHFTAWAYKILHNKVLEYFRRKARRNASVLATDDIDRHTDHWTPDFDLDMRLRKCIQKIIVVNPRYARILAGAYQGYSCGEMCKRLALTRTNFYTILSRARSLLKQCLETGDISQ